MEKSYSSLTSISEQALAIPNFQKMEKPEMVPHLQEIYFEKMFPEEKEIDLREF